MFNINKKLGLLLAAVSILFFSFVFYKSQNGLILFGDGNFSLWKNNSYLLNPFIWMNNDNGYYIPMMIISFPFQSIFYILTHFFDVYFVSILYFYGTIFGLIVSSIYLTKNVFKQANIIDHVLVMFFVVVNPLIAGIVLSQSDIAYSFVFVNLFIGYLFSCRGRTIVFKDVFVLSMLVLFVNSYILNTVLLLTVVFLYVVVFKWRYLLKNKAKSLFAICFFIFLNAFWLMNPAYDALIKKNSPNQSIVFYSDDAALGVLSESSRQIKSFLPFMFSHSFVNNPNHPAGFFTRNYIVVAAFSIAIFVFCIHLFFYAKGSRNKKLSIFFIVIFVFSYAFSMGTNNPLGRLFLLLWEYIPGFSLFRALFKFQFVVHFAFVILFILALEKMKSNNKIKMLFLIPMVVLSSYYFFDKFFVTLTKPTKVPGYYFENEVALKDKKIINTYKIFPDQYFSSKFIYTLFSWNGNNFDSANILRFFMKQTTSFTPFSGKYVDENIKKQLCYNEYNTKRDIDILRKAFAVQNIKNVIMQNDVLPSTSSCFEEIKELNKKSIGRLDIYSVDNNSFLPHFYIPNKLLISQLDESEIGKVFADKNFEINSSVFLSKQNFNRKDSIRQYFTQKEDEKVLPFLEFSKINPTKYRVRINNARGVFPLVMSEGYHDGWKAYLASPKQKTKNKIQDANLDNYKILDGNGDDQASKEELAGFLDNGLVSTLGDGKEKEIGHQKWDSNKQEEVPDYIEKYNIDFISKNFQGTIQNDNLPNGNIFETWLAKKAGDSEDRFLDFAHNDSVVQLPEESHLMANGYANSWIVDVEELCGLDSRLRGNDNESFCKKNSDGTYDMELVVEFWPQRLFYVGAGISLVTLLACLGYLGYGWRRSRRDIALKKDVKL